MPGAVQFAQAVTLVGGGELDLATLARARAHAPRLVAADGGADAALALGAVPELVVGDLDSITDSARVRLGPERLLHNPDQDTTDFDKVLAAVQAPLMLAVGFAGARLDHTLAAMNTLVRHPRRRVILDTGHDLCLLCPPELALDLPAECRVSLFPMAPLRCGSDGLRWPTAGLELAPDGRIGTSNAARGGRLRLTPDRPALLLMLPVATLAALLDALSRAPLWPDAAHAG